MIKIILSGSNGKMGKAIFKSIKENDDFTIAFGIQRKATISMPFPVYADIHQGKEIGDVIIDYSNPHCITNLLDFAVNKSTPIIIATTGFSETDISEIHKASNKIPILFSSNMSLGITALSKALALIAPMLGNDYEIEIIEKHHSNKLDSPSGTAIMLRDTIKNSLASNNEIKIHSLRSGTNPGEHSVIFSGKDEIIELKHQSYSRELFAQGTLKAAKWLLGKPAGLYSMNDIN